MFFGWYVVAGTFTAQLLIVGFFTYGVSLLVGPIREEFGVSLEQVMYSMTIGTFTGLLATPICGALLDRYSVRWIISSGIVLFAGGMWLTAQSTNINEYIWLFGLTYSITNALAGAMAASTTVSRWFTSSRGKALGIAAIGTSAGGIIIPALTAYWIAATGWRGALENLAAFAILIVLPIVIISVRSKPEDMGTQAEGVASADNPAAITDPGLTIKAILGKSSYWYIGLSLGVLFCIYASVLANLSPYAVEMGHSTGAASRLIMILAGASLVGKLIFGFMADTLNLKLGLWIAITLVALALAILSTEPSYLLLAAASVFLGLATGGMLPVWGAMVARVFGLTSYGKAMGLMGPVITLSVMPGFTIMGRLYDMSGGYQLGMMVFGGLTILSATLLFPLQLEDQR